MRVKRDKTPQQALQSLMRMCARSERSSGDALRLMKRWGVADDEAKKVLARLQADRFTFSFETISVAVCIAIIIKRAIAQIT